MYKCFIILLLFASNSCFSQIIFETDISYENYQYKAEINDSRKLVQELMSETGIPGLSIAIVRKDEMIWAEGFGFSDLENHLAVRLNTKFRIGSVSKSLTSLAIGKLAEDGKISWHDAVNNIVPYFPEKKYPVTVKELASHTAGIRNYDYDRMEHFSDTYYGSIQESVDVFKEDSLLFQPSTEYKYSTYGYVLLSAVIEQIANQSYLGYMKDSIFTPLGMHNTVPDINQEIIDHRAKFYQQNDSIIINAKYIDNSNKWAGGGYLSTSLDLAIMSKNLMNFEFLNKLTLEKLWTPVNLSNGKEIPYCLGWRKGLDELGRTYIHHGGSSIGGRSFLLMYPDEKLAVAITCNLYSTFDESFVLKVAENFMK